MLLFYIVHISDISYLTWVLLDVVFLPTIPSGTACWDHTGNVRLNSGKFIASRCAKHVVVVNTQKGKTTDIYGSLYNFDRRNRGEDCYDIISCSKNNTQRNIQFTSNIQKQHKHIRNTVQTMSVCLCLWRVGGLMGLKSLILTRIPVGSVHDSLITLVTALSHTHTHTRSSVTYHGYTDDTVLWGCSCRRIEEFLSEDRETTGRRRRTRRSDTASSSSASYTPLKVILETFIFFFFFLFECGSVFVLFLPMKWRVASVQVVFSDNEALKLQHRSDNTKDI